jgi:hypothetical protein
MTNNLHASLFAERQALFQELKFDQISEDYLEIEIDLCGLLIEVVPEDLLDGILKLKRVPGFHQPLDPGKVLAEPEILSARPAQLFFDFSVAQYVVGGGQSLPASPDGGQDVSKELLKGQVLFQE